MTTKRGRASDPYRAEAILLVSDAVRLGKVQGIDWFVERMVKRHPNVTGADADWYRYGAYGHARTIVRDVLMRSRGAGEDNGDDEQMTMAGFQFLQIAYDVVRDGKQVCVPTVQLTAPECRAKAAELRRIGQGALAHADELDQLADQLETNG